MRRIIPAAAATLIVAITAALTLAASSAQAAGSCSDSWGSDGHSGPWYTAPQTLHGNTLVITCPGGSTAWKVDYKVSKCPPSGGGSCFDPISATRSGTGSTSFSISESPIGCNVGWLYITHVHNTITGGDIYKPVGGHVIC